METFKIGDVVKIKNGSYMRTFNENGKITNRGSFESTKIIGLCKDPFRVIGVYCRPMPYGKADYNDKYNGYIIQNMKNKEMWYATEINIIKGNERYLVYWTEEWFKKHLPENYNSNENIKITKIVNKGFFCEENDFDSEDIKKVNALKYLGESSFVGDGICETDGNILVVKIR